jgi:hypothetical protein
MLSSATHNSTSAKAALQAQGERGQAWGVLNIGPLGVMVRYIHERIDVELVSLRSDEILPSASHNS